MEWAEIERLIEELQEEWRDEQRAVTREMHAIKGFSTEYRAASRRHDNATAKIDALWELKERLQRAKAIHITH